MSKGGKQKNTKNKGKHSKLMQRKKNKLRLTKEQRAARLKQVTEALKAARASI